MRSRNIRECWRPNPTVVLGVGNPLRRDDWIGCELVQALEEELKREDLIFIQGGMHPEAWAERIVQFKPSKLVVVEAMDMGAEVGEVRLLNPSQLKGFFSTTHRPSLALLLSYIGSRCEVKLLGVQVASLEFGEGMSKPIRSKLEELRERVRELILDLLGE